MNVILQIAGQDAPPTGAEEPVTGDAPSTGGRDAPPTGGDRMFYYKQRGKMPRLQGQVREEPSVSPTLLQWDNKCIVLKSKR